MHVIAPRALRRAGYEDLAVACENERDFLPGGAAAMAQYLIGREPRSSVIMPPLAQLACGASAHTSTCAFYSGLPQIESVVESGRYCATALLQPIDVDEADDVDFAEAVWIWDFAVQAINAAIVLGRNGNAEQVHT
jgi:hypothetical protein